MSHEILTALMAMTAIREKEPGIIIINDQKICEPVVKFFCTACDRKFTNRPRKCRCGCNHIKKKSGETNGL